LGTARGAQWRKTVRREDEWNGSETRGWVTWLEEGPEVLEGVLAQRHDWPLFETVVETIGSAFCRKSTVVNHMMDASAPWRSLGAMIAQISAITGSR
jgi:hypothetical protein